MATAKIITLKGKAWLVSADGTRRELQEGELVDMQDMILGEPGSEVSVDLGDAGEITLLGEYATPLFSEFMQELTVPQLVESQPVGTQPAEAPRSMRSSGSELEKGGQKIVSLVRIAEIIEADGYTPVEVARIQEILNPLGMALPDRERLYEEEREHLQWPTHSTAPLDLNKPPVPVGSLLNQDNLDSDESISLTLDLGKIFNDPDGDSLTYTVTGLPPGLSFDPKTGEITGDIPKNASQGGNNGVYKVTITATDPGGKSSEQSFNWTIKNPPPEAESDTNSTLKSVIIEVDKDNGVLKNDKDPDGDEIKVVGVVKGDTKTDDTTGVGNEVKGKYGTLILYPDGSYKYTPDLNNDDVWELAENNKLEDVFTYTISDGEGGFDNTTLTIELKGQTHTPPASIDGAITVDEKGLVGGSDEGNGHFASGTIDISALNGLKQITIGTTSFTSADLQGLAAGYVLYSESNGKLIFESFEPIYTNQSPVGSLAGLGAERVVGGKLYYRYELIKNQEHADGNGKNSGVINIALKVQDDQYNSDGSLSGGTQESNSNFIITVIDDVPTAKPDVNSVTEDDIPTATGNLLDNDQKGADGFGSTVSEITQGANSGTASGSNLVLAGKYGTLTVNTSSGEYTYELDPANTEVNALKTGKTLTEEFGYTMMDKDKDPSSSQLTITINGKTDGAPSIVPEDKNGNDPADPTDPSTVESIGHVTVHESGLTGGTKETDATNPHIVDGAIEINSPDGLESIVVGGTPISLEQLLALDSANQSTHIEIDTPSGKITITGFTPETSVGGVPTKGEMVFTYELTTPQNNDKNQGKDLNTTEAVELVVNDAGGESSTGSLVINIIDDAPLATADTGTVTEGATLTVVAANGVLDNDKSGADGWLPAGAVVGVAKGGDTSNSINTGVGTEIVGDFGTLTLHADGSYTYKAKPNSVTADGEKDVFTYTVRDADGDEATTTLTIDITNVSLTSTTTTTTVEESGLTGGSKEGDDTHKASNTVTVPSGQEVVPSSGTTEHGSFTIDENGNYTYTLNKTTSGDHTTDSFTYTTKDQYGNTVENTVTVNIVDDEPTAKDDTDTVEAGFYGEEKGNVITGEGTNEGEGGAGADIKGADGAKVSKIENAAQSTSGIVPNNGDPVTIQGKYGKLTIKEDGSYSYQRDPGTPGGVDDVFGYTLTDGDGDYSTATLTITITNAKPELKDLSVSGDALTFYEKNLTTGTSPDTDQLTKGGSFTIDSGDGVKSLTVKDKDNNEVEIIASNELVDANKVIETPAGKLTITGYNKDTGEVTYTYELTTTQGHDAQGVDSKFDDIQLTLKDFDDTEATGTIKVTVVDDVPVINEKIGDVSLTVAEANFNVDDTKGFSVLFDINHGADGKASTEYTLGIADGGASGLVDTLSGKAVVLSLDDSGNIIGKAGNETVLQISIDKATGEITLDQIRSVKHENSHSEDFDQDIIKIATAGVTLTATAKDSDGDTTSKTIGIGDRFNFKDAGPAVQADQGNAGTVNEKYLPTGSAGNAPDKEPVVITKKFTGLNFGADGAGDAQFTEATVNTLKGLGLKANNQDLEYVLSADGHSIIAYRGEGRAASDKIFTVEITDPKGTPGYKFTLQGALDHVDGNNDTLDINFDSIKVTDGDGDSVTTGFDITVEDDDPSLEAKKITVIEDSTDKTVGNTFNTNADALGPDANGNGGNTTIGDGTGDTVAPKYGTATVNPDGTITYVPKPNYSGKDTFTYTTTTDNETKTFTVNVDVTPVADAPNLGDSTINLSTQEGHSIQLGLTQPVITDNEDQNEAEPGDNPERLGVITLNSDVVLKYGDENLLKESSGSYKIIIVDGAGNIDTSLHHSDLVASDGSVNYLTKEQYESITAYPGPYDHKNFEVKVSVKSYEVDGSGSPLDDGLVSGGNGAESTQTIKVDVLAVTNEPELVIAGDNSIEFDEDTTLDLTDKLEAKFVDTDGSESFWFEVTELEPGTKVTIGTKTYTADTQGKIDSSADPIKVNNSSIKPTFKIEPPKDFSGDMDGVKITLKVQDSDSDSSGHTPDIKQTEVTLNLYVKPVAGDVEAKPVQGDEDTPINFLENVKVTDASTDQEDGGKEIITKVEFAILEEWRDFGFAIPVNAQDEEVGGWTVTPADSSAPFASDTVTTITRDEANGGGKWTVKISADGKIVTISADGNENEILDENDLQEILDKFVITPPAHSSKDGEFKLDITSQDTANKKDADPVVSTKTVSNVTLEVKVNPVAERVGTDTDGDGTDDLTMTEGHSYTTAGVEDEWFSLGTAKDKDGAVIGSGDGKFNLKDGWVNQDGKDAANGNASADGSEETFAVLTPVLIDKNGNEVSANGAMFEWDGGSAIFGGEAIEVPLSALDSLKFKGPENFSGMFKIKVQAKTVDTKDDDPSVTVEAISGEAWLENVLIAPKADTSTTSLTARVEGNEDEMMPLSIRPKSSDPDETFNITIDKIPSGAILTYGNYVITESGVYTTGGFDADGRIKTGTEITGSDLAQLGIKVEPSDSGKWKVEFEDFKSETMTITAPLDSNEEFKLDVYTQTVDVLTLPADTDLNGIDLPNHVDKVTNSDGTISLISKSDPPEKLSMDIAPKGVADQAIIELAVIDFTEASADESGIPINALFSQLALKDNDGSETLSFKVGNLPEGFTIEGATFIGNGTWSFSKADYDANQVKIKPTPNYNGKFNFDFYTITTENDGDSLTQQHEIEVTVTPSPEAGMNLSSGGDEDTSFKLNFSVEYKNGDDDEFVSAVWIKADSIKDGLGLTLGSGAGAKSLADAASDASNTDVVLEDGYYKISGDGINNIYAQGAPNRSGSTSFDVRYEITDPGNGLADVSEVSAADETYKVTINPVTDQVTLAVTNGNSVVMENSGTHTVKLSVGNTDGQGDSDYDGSEQLTRIIVENVPGGVVLKNTGAHFIGGGTWVLVVDESMKNEPLTPELKFQVHGAAGGLTNHKMKVTVISEDSGNGQETKASTEVSLTTSFGKGGEETPAKIDTWEQKEFEPTEDTAFKLSDAITGVINDEGVSENGFTITLTGLPKGTEVEGMVKTIVNGEEVWSATGSGGNDALQTLLDSIKVKPPLNWNENHNAGDFSYTATLTTHVPSGGKLESPTLTIRPEITPVTDDAVIEITATPVTEGKDLNIKVDISNEADGGSWTLIDGKLYLQVDSAVAGDLYDSTGAKLNVQSVSGVDGVTNGSYYVINLGTETSVDLVFKPNEGEEYAKGDVTINAWVQGKENDATNIKTTNNSTTTKFEPANSGYDLKVTGSTGDENSSGAKATDGSNLIEIEVGGDGLNDSGEKVDTILLSNLPNGFLVYIGDNAENASLAEMANNAGGDGTTNTWLLGDKMPKYIGILPPKNWSGTIEGIEFTVISGEPTLSEKDEKTVEFDLTATPVADGVELNPTASFGKEGEIIGLNLNANLKDLHQAGDTDQHVELITLQFSGMGEHAAFYIGDYLISGTDRVVDNGNGTYTIKGLSQDDVDNLGFIQAKDSINNLKVKAQSQEYEVGSDGKADLNEPVGVASDPTAEKTIIANITNQFGTTDDDELLYTGSFIDGRGGDDTIQLRFGESIGHNGTNDFSNLKNIEVISMEGNGSNSITCLTAEDVFKMTDSDNNLLKILGDNDDTLDLSGGLWTKNEDGKYQATHAGTDVFLQVGDNVNIIID